MAEQIEEAKDKAKLVLLEGGPGLTIERILAFSRKMLGRELTEDEIAKTYEDLRGIYPEK